MQLKHATHLKKTEKQVAVWLRDDDLVIGARELRNHGNLFPLG